MKKYALMLLILMSTHCHSQQLRRNQQSFYGQSTGVSVTGGSSVITAVTVGTTQGILKRIIVQNAGGIAAGSSNSFSVRICNKSGACDTEGAHAIFQKLTNTTLGNYPFGLYTTTDIIWKNTDTPVATQTMYVRITNNGSTNSFDIYLSGLVTEQ